MLKELKENMEKNKRKFEKGYMNKMRISIKT